MTAPKPRNCPLFRLSPEIRLMIYEELLVQSNRPLRLIKGPKDEVEPFDGNNICTSILRTCWAVYNETLPVLYGRNILLIRILPVSQMSYPPEHLLALIKHVKITAAPFEGGDSLETARCLRSIDGANLDDLSIRIYIPYTENYYYSTNSLRCVLKSFKNNLLVADNPILPALLSLTSVKKLYIELEDGARFEPGFAKLLKESFMKKGSREGRSIVIEKRCLHEGADICGSPVAKRNFENGARCFDCANTKEEIAKDTADWEYKDDEVTHKAVTKWHFMRQVLAKYKAEELLVPETDKNDDGSGAVT